VLFLRNARHRRPRRTAPPTKRRRSKRLAGLSVQLFQKNHHWLSNTGVIQKILTCATYRENIFWPSNFAALWDLLDDLGRRFRVSHERTASTGLGGPFAQPIVKGNTKEKLAMKIFFCIATAAALSAVSASAAITPTEQTAIVTGHNNERANTGPSPGVAALTWSTDLATYAQAWAQTLATRDQGLAHRDSSPNSADFTINNPFKPM
jgi:hypothetical protein